MKPDFALSTNRQEIGYFCAEVSRLPKKLEKEVELFRNRVEVM